MSDFTGPHGRCPMCGQEFVWDEGPICDCYYVIHITEPTVLLEEDEEDEDGEGG